MAAPPVPDVRFVCRQCPPGGFGIFVCLQLSNICSLAGRANASVIPTDFQCRPGQKHILCQCCVQPMPDRLGELNIHQSCK